MKKIKNTLFIAGLISAFILTGCKASDTAKNALEIKEQPDMVIQDTSKIYPNEIGDISKDPIVQNSNIDGYMKKYNKNAEDESKINYDSIRYNQAGNYYYVNDTNRKLGIKFVLGDVGQIVSASIYSGNTADTGVNMVDVISAAANTFGYGYISDKDRKQIKSIQSQIDKAQGNIDSSLSLFNGSLDMSVSLQNSVSLVSIPAMTQYFTSQDIARADAEMTSSLNTEIEHNKNNNKVDSLAVPEKPSDKFNNSTPTYDNSNLSDKWKADSISASDTGKADSSTDTSLDTELPVIEEPDASSYEDSHNPLLPFN